MLSNANCLLDPRLCLNVQKRYLHKLSHCLSVCRRTNRTMPTPVVEEHPFCALGSSLGRQCFLLEGRMMLCNHSSWRVKLKGSVCFSHRLCMCFLYITTICPGTLCYAGRGFLCPHHSVNHIGAARKRSERRHSSGAAPLWCVAVVHRSVTAQLSYNGLISWSIVTFLALSYQGAAQPWSEPRVSESQRYNLSGSSL